MLVYYCNMKPIRLKHQYRFVWGGKEWINAISNFNGITKQFTNHYFHLTNVNSDQISLFFAGLRLMLKWWRCTILIYLTTLTSGPSSWNSGTKCSKKWESRTSGKEKWWVAKQNIPPWFNFHFDDVMNFVSTKTPPKYLVNREVARGSLGNR